MTYRLPHVGLLLLLMVSLCGAPAVAQDDGEFDPTRTRKELDQLERTLAAGTPSDEALGEAIRVASSARARAVQCGIAGQADVERLAQSLSAVGEPVSGENRELTKQRRDLAEQRSRAEARLAECRLLAVRGEETLQRLTERQQELLRQRMVSRDPHLWDLAMWNLRNYEAWVEPAAAFVRERAGLDRLASAQGGLVALLTALGVAMGVWLGHALRRRAAPSEDASMLARLGGALPAVLRRHAPPTLGLAGLAAGLGLLDLQHEATAFISIGAYAALGLALVLTAIRVALAPPRPQRQITPLDDSLAQVLAWRLGILAATLILGAVLLGGALAEALPEQALALLRVALVTVVVINLGWLLWLLGRIPALARSSRTLRGLLLIALTVILLAEWLGYRNLSAYLLLGLLGSTLVAGAYWAASTLLGETLDGLDSGSHPWQARLRERIGLDAGEPFPGLVWLRFLLTLTIWGASALLLLRAWGLSDAGVALVMQYLVEGFTVGQVQIVPSQVVAGIFLFALLLTASRWLRDWVEHSWVPRTRMDHGAGEAMVTITGYVGFVLAMVVGLSTAGVDFANLAIIAGALSVGIGFGLQNIVSNFVAGIILLFERPIKTGDWVVVGGTEGYVKRISVRATEIQTFDRSDVTVPNSDFISNHVTNWMLRDRHGRARVPIGVAYGSDTQLVKRLLLEIAEQVPGIMGAHTASPPNVMFMGFGASSLDMELRFHVYKVEDRMGIISEVNFAIDRAFREHGIEIPFPQQDVHVRSWSAPPPSGTAGD